MTSRPAIVYCGPSEALDALTAAVAHKAEVIAVPPETISVSRALAKADAYLDASMKVRITRAMIDSAEHLRIIAVAATGADHVDAAALKDRAIPLLTLRGQTSSFAISHQRQNTPGSY